MVFLGLTPSQWEQIAISGLVFLAAILLGRFLINRLILPLLLRLTSRTRTGLDDVIVDALSGPMRWLLIVAALEFALGRLGFIPDLVQFNLDELYFVLYLLIVFMLLWRLIMRVANWYSADFARHSRAEAGRQLMPFVSRVSLIVTAVIAITILLSHFDVEISGLVATLGIGSLAIALAAQATLSDTISGFMIMIDRPFRIGDRIEILDLDTWGDVMDIGLRSCRIRTRDNRMVIVPNSVIGKSLVVNHSYPDDRYRLQVEVGVAYGTDLEQARKVIVDAVSAVEGVERDKPVEALFLHFGDSALIFRVRWWLNSYLDTRRMFDRVNTAIYHALNEAGIEIPFPHTVVQYKLDPESVAGLPPMVANKPKSD